MKLIVAHQILIGSAIGLAALFAIRGVVLFARGDGAVNLALGIAAALVGAALGAYLRSLRAKLGREGGGAPGS